MNKSLLLLIFTALLFSCSDKKRESSGAWFGGQIVNPTADYVVLTKNDEVVDTILLDDDNRFLYKLEEVDKGIYNFIHNEYQIIYLEPGDSLMLHLNTIEFDESLAFSGIGAKRNNLLINMFLHSEEEESRMPQYYRLEAEEFIRKVDSMKSARLERLETFTSKKKTCSEFDEVVKASIIYDYYLKREIYPFAYYGFGNYEEMKNLPEDYYDFRKDIDYNNENLQSYYPYYRFLNQHFDYLAFDKYKDEVPYSRESYAHNFHKLSLISENVQIDFLRDKLLRTAVRVYVINSKNAEEASEIVDLYYSLSSNNFHKDEVRRLMDASLLLMPGNKIPNLELQSFTGKMTNFQNIIRRPAVIYFWTTHSVNHHRNVHVKVDELKRKYPEFQFIAVSTEENTDLWKQTIQRNNYNKDDEFRFTNREEAINSLVINTISKTLIVDKNGVIVDNHTNLFRTYFEEQLLGFLNQ